MQHKIDNTLPAIRAHNNIAAFVVYELSSRSWSSLALSCAQIFICTIAIPYHGADNQICCCVSVYVCVCLWTRLRSHFSTNLYEIWQRPLGSEKKELIRLGSKSENAFLYLTPQKTKFTANLAYQPNIKCKMT